MIFWKTISNCSWIWLTCICMMNCFAHRPVFRRSFQSCTKNTLSTAKKDVEDYLKLLALTDEYFDQIISFEKEKADAGLFMSDFACQNIIDQCNAFIADSDNHYLIETFNTRIDKLTGLTQSEKRPLQTAERKNTPRTYFSSLRKSRCCADRPFRFRNQ